MTTSATALKRYRWTKLSIPPDQACCSEGSPFYTRVKRGTSPNLVVFFSGGGLAWDAASAANPITPLSLVRGKGLTYWPTISVQEHILMGMLAANDPRNPFNDWNVIHVLYATGDLHVGNQDFAYSDARGQQRILHHYGARNVVASLEAAKGLLPEPEHLLIVGESAGAWGCLAQAERVMQQYPGAQQITVFSDSAQIAYPRWKELVRDQWGAEPSLYECIQSQHLNLDWFRRLYAKYGDRIHYLNACSCRDGLLTSFQTSMNYGKYQADAEGLAEFQSGLADAQRSLLGGIPGFQCYISALRENPRTGATAHTAIRFPWFHQRNEGGISMADWLRDSVVAGKRYSVGLELLGLEAG